MQNEKSNYEIEINKIFEKKRVVDDKIKSYNFTFIFFILSILIGGILGSIYEIYLPFSERIPHIIIGCILGVIIYIVIISYMQSLLKTKSIKYSYELISAGVNILQDNLEENFFTKFVQINFKHLDRYYFQTQIQADKSFILTAFASIIGLIIIVTGIILMFLGKTTPAYLTTATGLISEFISAIFFYFFNRTILKMGEYHKKLVITQNIGLALKISESLPQDEKIKSQQKLIDKLSEKVNEYLVK